MKSKKLLIILIVCIIIIITSVTKIYYANSENTIELAILTEERQYKKGDIITINMQITSIPNSKQINVLGFMIDMDNEFLEINSIYDEDEGSNVLDMKALREWSLSYDEESKCILLTRQDLYSNINENIFRINLKVKKDFDKKDIKITDIESAGGATQENTFYSNDISLPIQGMGQQTTDKLYLSTSEYKIGETNTQNYEDGDEYLYKVSPNTTIEEFKDDTNLKTNGNISVYNANGEEQTNLNELVKTGMKIKVAKEGYEDIELIISVIGDIDGDGIVTASDLADTIKAVLSNFNLKEEQFKAIDMDEDKSITAADLADEIKLSLM